MQKIMKICITKVFGSEKSNLRNVSLKPHFLIYNFCILIFRIHRILRKSKAVSFSCLLSDPYAMSTQNICSPFPKGPSKKHRLVCISKSLTFNRLKMLPVVKSGLAKIINTSRNVTNIQSINLFSPLIFSLKNLF